MRPSIALLFLASACGFPGAEGRATDAMGEPDGPDCATAFLNLCAQTARNEDFLIDGTTIDTNTDGRCTALKQTSGPDVCLLYYNKVEVNGTLLVTGARPFALVAKGTMIIRGTIDASSKTIRATQPGAGGGLMPGAGLCAFGTAPQEAGGGGGGGAGGTFATQGGKGGIGNTDNSGGGMPNRAGGNPGPIFDAPTFLRGGCDGQDGAIGDPVSSGAGGRGGGAVYLSAASLHITGTVTTGGAGGAATPGRDDGGGGGGSGGLIVVQAASLAVNGASSALLANGGGGSKGANGNEDGAAGADATTASAALGGTGGQPGGNGGNGATTGIGLDGMPSGGGGGGGGGGAGFILLLGESIDKTGATIVPTPIERTK